MVRSGAQYGIDRFFFLQHFAEIFVIRHLAVWGFLRIMFLDFVPQRQTSGVALVIKGVQILGLNRVCDRDDLDVSLLKQSPCIGLALPPASNNCEVNFFTRRNKFRPAKNMPWHEAKPGCYYSCAVDKFASCQA